MQSLRNVQGSFLYLQNLYGSMSAMTFSFCQHERSRIVTYHKRKYPTKCVKLVIVKYQINSWDSLLIGLQSRPHPIPNYHRDSVFVANNCSPKAQQPLFRFENFAAPGGWKVAPLLRRVSMYLIIFPLCRVRSLRGHVQILIQQFWKSKTLSYFY